jgi:hypothetical protein
VASLTSASSSVGGTGVFAVEEILAGETLGYFEGHEVAAPTGFSLTFDGKIIEPTSGLRHLNHSCSANAEFRGRYLVAKRSIARDEEVLIDYLATEADVSIPFECNCGSKRCRGHIGSAAR